MNLVVDVGNTLTKFAVFLNHKLHYKISTTTEGFSDCYHKTKSAFPSINSCILSSVGNLSKNQINVIEQDVKTFIVNHKTKLPFRNLYKTPETLGVDRMALVAAAVLHYPDKNVLIIDAGTCVTYDFINHKASYLGGAISPGLHLRLKSLNDYTTNLPLLEPKLPKNLIGNTTETSILSGVIYGLVNEIDKTIEKYQEKYSDLTVILTGGDTIFLSDQLKNSIFAHSDFLVEGLNYILEYNSNSC